MISGAITTTKSINIPSVLSGSTALAANEFRQGWMIQNLGTNPLYVCMGSTASTSVFHFILKACTAQDDGTGGVFSDTAGAVYYGVITVAGTTPRYVVTEL